MASGDRREGRGRLSSIDMLPEEAEPDIVWALAQLNDRSMPQGAILAEFNARLADRGIAKVSKSSFNRWSVRKALAFRELDGRRLVARELVGALGNQGADEMTVVLSEMLKCFVMERMESGEVSDKSLALFARVVKTSQDSQHQALKTKLLRDEAEAETKRKLDETFAKAGEALSGEKAHGADPALLLKKIREDVYGIFER